MDRQGKLGAAQVGLQRQHKKVALVWRSEFLVGVAVGFVLQRQRWAKLVKPAVDFFDNQVKQIVLVVEYILKFAEDRSEAAYRLGFSKCLTLAVGNTQIPTEKGIAPGNCACDVDQEKKNDADAGFCKLPIGCRGRYVSDSRSSLDTAARKPRRSRQP